MKQKIRNIHTSNALLFKKNLMCLQFKMILRHELVNVYLSTYRDI